MRNRSVSSPLRFCLVAALVPPCASASAGDIPPDLRALAELRDLYAKYRCPVADRLQRLYEAGDPAQDRDRFIVVAIKGRAQAYVQCIFHDRETAMFCEAASGFYVDPPRRDIRAKDKIAALGRLGFSTDGSAGNFKLDTKVATPPDVRAIAELILHDGYGAQATTPLAFDAPFAPGLTFGCDPVG